MAIRDGWRPEIVKKKKEVVHLIDLAREVLRKKLSLDYSQSYKKDLKRTLKLLKDFKRLKKYLKIHKRT